MTDQTLARHASTSVLWMTAQKWISRGSGFLTVLVLTRNLAPEDFGVAAAASTLMPLVYVLSDVGFSTYIVQAKESGQRTLSTAFWFSLASGLVLAGAVYIGAPVIGVLLGVPEVGPLLRAMSLSVLLIAVGSVPTALMRRRMSFRALATMEVVSSMVGNVAAIWSAVLGAGPWSLVLQILAYQATCTVWVWCAARWLPSLQFSGAKFREMTAFGVHAVGSALSGVLRWWAQTAIVVAGLGVREMGYINIAQRLVQAALDLTVSSVEPVAVVAFSKMRESVSRLRTSYLRVADIAFTVVAPLMIGVLVTAPVLLPFLFGPEQAESASVAPAIAVVSLVSVGWSVDEALHLGSGRPGRWFVFKAAIFTVSILILAATVRYGLSTFLLAFVATAILEAVGRWVVVARLLKTSPLRVAMPMLGNTVPIALTTLVGFGVSRLSAAMPALAELTLTGVAIVVTYVLAVRLLRPATFADVVTVLPDRVSSRLGWALPRSGAFDGRGAMDHDGDITAVASARVPDPSTDTGAT